MIWHNGRLYTYDGWHRQKNWFGWVTLRPARGFPGYVRLIELGTNELLVLRADRVMVNTQPV